MKTLEFVQRPDSDKFVRVAIPVEDATQSYRLIVLVEPENAAQQSKPQDEWPPGFIERTYGGWKGELERAPQGDYEERTPF
jgi:hypothetical protein